MSNPAPVLPLSIIIPFYNEEAWIGATIDSFVRQTDQRFRLLLVNNRSNDKSVEIAAKAAAQLGDRAIILSEGKPGKIHALAHGLARTVEPLIATCDADTIYPPNYVETILRLAEARPDAAMIMAIDLYDPVDSVSSMRRLAKILGRARRAPRKCFAGGYAQTFRTHWLREAGGFDATSWPYILEDHEVVSRVQRFGPSVYDAHLYCFPSTRRVDRSAMHWTRFERLTYRFVPARWTEAYFHRFLGPRFARRDAFAVAQREKNWDEPVL